MNGCIALCHVSRRTNLLFLTLLHLEFLFLKNWGGLLYYNSETVNNSLSVWYLNPLPIAKIRVAGFLDG
jgi:hypothetical protein